MSKNELNYGGMIVKRKLLSMVLMMSIVFTIHTMISYAASFSADDLIAHAKSHIGQKVSQFTDSSGASGKWCAWFVEHCSSQLGYSSIIPTSGCEDVNNLAYSIVNNKNGTITFVNETFYKAKKSNFNARAYLNKSYQQRRPVSFLAALKAPLRVLRLNYNLRFFAVSAYQALKALILRLLRTA